MLDDDLLSIRSMYHDQLQQPCIDAISVTSQTTRIFTAVVPSDDQEQTALLCWVGMTKSHFILGVGELDELLEFGHGRHGFPSNMLQCDRFVFDGVLGLVLHERCDGNIQEEWILSPSQG